jgi:hypothetical protein
MTEVGFSGLVCVCRRRVTVALSLRLARVDDLIGWDNLGGRRLKDKVPPVLPRLSLTSPQSLLCRTGRHLVSGDHF